MGLPPWISVAPVHVVVGVREESYHERYRKADKLVDGEEITWPAPYWYVDAGSMFMLLQLAALPRASAPASTAFPARTCPRSRSCSACRRTCTSSASSRSAGSRPTTDDSPLVSRLTQARKPLDELVRWERWET